MSDVSSKSGTKHRVLIFLSLIILATGLVSYRLFRLTFLEHDSYVQAARSQYINATEVLTGRGTIYFTDQTAEGRRILSTNKDALFVYADDREVNLADSAVKELATILEMELEELNPLLEHDTSHQLIKRDITEGQADEIRELGFTGIKITSETVRYYPDGDSASHVAGFVGFDGHNRVGQYGIEAYYDDDLSGEGEDHGSDIVLTIDPMIQQFIENKLEDLVELWSAESGSVIVQDPETGAIIAMASVPAYDPNIYWESNLEDFPNPVMQKPYEPGSTFKPFTMAAGLNTNALTPDTTYNDTGTVTIGGYKLSNFDGQARGIQTMSDVLQKSLNTGTIFAQKRTGNDAFLNHVVSFGFGEQTGIDLAGEAEGAISNLYSNNEVNFATASFGQGIAVTPLQLINAYSSIANGGKLMKPFIVKEVIHTDGTRDITEPEIIDAPIKSVVAKQLQSMLTDVADKSQMNARIEGYDVAVKTGTAQIADPKGGYLEDEVIHNFVGFAPSYAPEFVVMIKLDRPVGVRYAASSLAGPFTEITRFLLNYYNIPPTRI
ncbi:MAG: penicillin-binding protein 2 [Parcubacteria group bacterium]